jgi:hypothetical protein
MTAARPDQRDGEEKMLIIVWSPDDLIEQMTDLTDDGWEIIGYWFNDLAKQREGFVLAGRDALSREHSTVSAERST